MIPTPTPRWTDGPWQPAGALATDNAYDIVANDGTIIARVHGGLTTPGDEDGEDGQSEANATVIALVPDLLDIVTALADGHFYWAAERAEALVRELKDPEGDRWAIR